MTSIRLDKVIMSSFHESFLNYATTQGTIVVSGTIASSTTTSFTTSIVFGRANTITTVFYTHSSISGKRIFGGAVPLVRTGVEPGRLSGEVRYTSTGADLIINVFNPTTSYTIATQTYTLYVVQYDAPISL